MLFWWFEISGKIRKESPGSWSSDAFGSVSHLVSVSHFGQTLARLVYLSFLKFSSRFFFGLNLVQSCANSLLECTPGKGRLSQETSYKCSSYLS